MLVYVLFYLGQLSHFPSRFGAGVTNLNEPPLSFLLHPPHYCRLGAGSIPFRAIVNNKQSEGVVYVAGHPLLNRRCARLPWCIRLRNGRYCVGWDLVINSIHSLRHAIFWHCALKCCHHVTYYRFICFVLN